MFNRGRVKKLEKAVQRLEEEMAGTLRKMCLLEGELGIRFISSPFCSPPDSVLVTGVDPDGQRKLAALADALGYEFKRVAATKENIIVSPKTTKATECEETQREAAKGV